MTASNNTFEIKTISDLAEIEAMRVQMERFERDWDWIAAHSNEVYSNRGKYVFVAGQELFVADSLEEVLAWANATHPEDNGRVTRRIPVEKGRESMRMDGMWRLCDDGILRPTFRATVLAADGRRVAVDFLADTGADRTVLCAELFHELGLPSVSAPNHLEGVGGQVEAFIVETDIRITRETGEPISIKGKYAAFADPAATDMNVLGRDITNLFPLIVDRPGDTVCLLGPGHRYAIVES